MSKRSLAVVSMSALLTAGLLAGAPGSSAQTRSAVASHEAVTTAAASGLMAAARRVQPKRSIRVVVSGLPSGVKAKATITGPHKYRKVVTKSVLLERLRVGSYKITAKPV